MNFVSGDSSKGKMAEGGTVKPITFVLVEWRKEEKVTTVRLEDH